MEKKPQRIKEEIFGIIFMCITGLFFALWVPKHPLSGEMIRNINAAGMWFQLIGAITVSFELLRGPLAEKQRNDYNEQKSSISSDFNNRILKIESSREKLEAIDKHTQKVSELEKIYFSVINFEVTVRRVYLLGLFFICFGYLLQLCVI